MKKSSIITAVVGVCLSSASFASWQMVAPTTVGGGQSPFFQSTSNQSNLDGQFGSINASDNIGFSSAATGMTDPLTGSTSIISAQYQPYALHVYPGTLKSNLQRIMKTQNWKMLWNSKYDYHVISEATIHGRNFQDALNKLLLNYPMQAVFYNQNDIMTIVSRKQ